MHHISLRVGRKTPRSFYLPASWADLKIDQWQQVGRIVDDPKPEHLFALLALWSGLTLTHLTALDDAQRLALLDQLNWLDTPPGRWMEPTLKLRGETLRGPGDDLESLSFGGFLFAEQALKKITDEPGLLITGRADLFAALYSPLDHQRRRQPFSTEAMNERSQQLGVFDQLLARTHYNYLGARAELIRLFPGIFKPTAGEQENASSNTWLDVGLSLARQTNALGTYAQLEQTNVYLVLTTLQALIDEADRLKKAQQ